MPFRSKALANETLQTYSGRTPNVWTPRPSFPADGEFFGNKTIPFPPGKAPLKSKKMHFRPERVFVETTESTPDRNGSLEKQKVSSSPRNRSFEPRKTWERRPSWPVAPNEKEGLPNKIGNLISFHFEAGLSLAIFAI